MFPGPVSKATTCEGPAFGGSAVRLPMPPRFCSTRPRVGMAKQHVVEQRDQGSTLSADHHIGGAKVRDHGNAALLRQHRHLADLPGAGCLAAEVTRGSGLVIDGLTMAADQIQVAGMALQRDRQAPRNRPGPVANSSAPAPPSQWLRHSSPPARRGAGPAEKGSRHDARSFKSGDCRILGVWVQSG